MVIPIAWSLPAEARGPRETIDVSATSLPQAVGELAREANVSIGAEGPLPRVSVHPVKGAMSIESALARMLAGSGFRARRVGPTAWRIERDPRPEARSSRRQIARRDPVPTRPAPLAAEIIVTGNKEVLSLGETPSAVSVVKPSGLPGPAAGNGSGAVAAETEGLVITGEGVGRNRMFIRGIADSPFAGSSQSTVAVLLGDTRLTWSAPDPDLRLVDVERVEVLKGPQGSLYGTGALGGIYRVVPRPADPATATYEVGAAAASVAGGERGANGYAVANLPVVRDRAALRLIAFGDLVPGWLDTGTRPDSNRTTAVGTRATLGIDPGKGWRIDATGLGQWLNSADSGYVYARHARTRPAQVAEPHDNDLLHGSLRIAREGGPVSFLFTTGYTGQTVDDRYDATIGADGLGLPDPLRLDDDRKYTVWDSEARANGRAGSFRWLAGVSYIEATRHQTRRLTNRGGDTLVLDSDLRRANEAAIYGRATISPLKAFDVTVGARLSQSYQRIRRGNQTAEGQRTESVWTFAPSLKLSWQPRYGRLLYLGYDEGRREGGATIAADGSLDRLDGDELTTISAGWREGAGPLRFDIGLYGSRWRNVQSDVLRPGGLIETRNVGAGSVIGGEVSFDADIARGWSISGGAMVQSAMLDLAGASVDPVDRRLPVVPRSTLRLGATRAFALGSWDITASVHGRYVGKGRLSFDPALDRKLGGYLETSLRLAAERGRWRAELSAANLFNSRADVFAYGNPLRVLGYPQHVPLDPRRVVLSLTWKAGSVSPVGIGAR